MEVYFFLTANKANRLKVILSKETKVTQSNLNDVPFLKVRGLYLIFSVLFPYFQKSILLMHFSYQKVKGEYFIAKRPNERVCFDPLHI